MERQRPWLGMDVHDLVQSIPHSIMDYWFQWAPVAIELYGARRMPELTLAE